MAHRVLVVEDESDVARLLAYSLEQAGHEVTVVGDGTAALARAEATPPEVVVLDVMLPDLDGFEVCRRLRAGQSTSDVGILMLTARGEAEDRILGLESGADDYVVKPFVVREVVLRVGALAGRVAERRWGRAQAPSPQDALLRVGALSIDPVTHQVSYEGGLLHLRPLEYRLLVALAAAPGKVFSREELLSEVWGMRGDVTTRTVDVHVRRLRLGLGSAADLIETVHGFGYRAKRPA